MISKTISSFSWSDMLWNITGDVENGNLEFMEICSK